MNLLLDIFLWLMAILVLVPLAVFLIETWFALLPREARML
jgi:hypothetical protein